MKSVQIVDQKESWKADFEREKLLLESVLHSVQTNIHHIGSTAVPNLAAKPVIDILVEVSSLHELDGLEPNMINNGYRAKGEYGIEGRRYFTKGIIGSTHHIHAFEKGSSAVLRHIAFRDYLIGNPAVAVEYATLKRQAATANNRGVSEYSSFKSDFVRQHQELALQWMKAESSR